MTRLLTVLYCLLCSSIAGANTLHGRVTDNKQQPLPFATILIKGTTTGTTTNASGSYQLDLPAGTYTIVCQYMGYRKTESVVNINTPSQQLDFTLQPLSMQIREVVIKSGGEDPAYTIIREAIKKRPYYNNQVKAFTCMAYIKGKVKSLDMPEKFFGQKIDKKELGVDSTGEGVLFLSESITKLAVQSPNKVKVEVISSRKSGGGIGFDFPAIISFYENNVNAVVTEVGPRGFISPIANNALLYYRYKLEGVFYEDGKAVNKIRVMPRRRFEPLFSGHIYITDGDWHIHSADLLLTKEYQLEMMDTLRIRQSHVPVTGDIWRIKDQLIHISLRRFGFAVAGDFVNVYSDYNLQPDFSARYFDKVLMRYDSAFDKKNKAYWDSIRPVPLDLEEKKDFRVKDSTAKAQRDSSYSRNTIDSLKRKQLRLTPLNILWKGGIRRQFYFVRDSNLQSHRLEVKPLLQSLKYNTVEGLVVSVEPVLRLNLDKSKTLKIDGNFRYGTSNTHFNAYTYFSYITSNRSGRSEWTLGGGKRVSQFNHDNPINALGNEIYTLLFKENYMKIYENWFGEFRYHKTYASKTRIGGGLTYESRIPLVNTTDFVFFKNDDKSFTPNHPYELAHVPFKRHDALVLDLSLRFQPGQRYVELPDSVIAVSSKFPTFDVAYSKGIPDIGGSVVNFDKWSAGVQDEVNLKLFGEFRYRVEAGGFINAADVELPDYRHFNGNQTFYNIKYLNSFQLAPYYRYSTTASFYATAHAEHHFNGLLTNKVPLLRSLKWHLVAGSNAFYVNRDNNYVEVFAGLENIFKVLRVDVIAGYQSQDNTRIGVRVGFGGIFGNMIQKEM